MDRESLGITHRRVRRNSRSELKARTVRRNKHRARAHVCVCVIFHPEIVF